MALAGFTPPLKTAGSKPSSGRFAPRRKAAQGSPTERFKFDPHHDVDRCPARKQLRPRDSSAAGKRYRADRRDCACCPLKAQCLRGLENRKIQAVLNAVAMNLKKLAAAMLLIWSIIENRTTRPTTASV
ncbi:hypothetical protein [Albidovulum sp.]|uniref:hypothetical protein n=1 Tax=Albidovulum sp. TaxID=1872424 RepID=UPI003D7DE2EC